MKKTTIVALMILSDQCVAGTLNDSLQDIESEWAIIHYSTPKKTHQFAYNKLFAKVNKLAIDYPTKAEPLIWEAIIKACNADNVNPVDAIEDIHEAHDLLETAIKIEPTALSGSAYVTLGALYHLTPQWPIGFGDENTAKSLFESALKINPNGIESNHYYAEYLLSQDLLSEAEKYFKIALSAPSRTEQKFADDQLKELAFAGLQQTLHRKKETSNGLFSAFTKKDNLN